MVDKQSPPESPDDGRLLGACSHHGTTYLFSAHRLCCPGAGPHPFHLATHVSYACFYLPLIGGVPRTLERVGYTFLLIPIPAGIMLSAPPAALEEGESLFMFVLPSLSNSTLPAGGPSAKLRNTLNECINQEEIVSPDLLCKAGGFLCKNKHKV